MECVVYDVAIIGGGVVGCALLNKFTLCGYRCVLLEKNEHLVTGASSGNSGIAHTGFDASPGKLEMQCILDSRPLIESICRENDVPFIRRGAIVVAWNKTELKRLPSLVQQARKHGDFSVKLLSREELLMREPELCDQALGGVYVPGEAVLDTWLLPVTLAHQARRHGAKVLTGSEIKGGHLSPDGSTWVLQSVKGTIRAKVVVNAAGLFGDRIEEISHPSSFQISPRKGQFVVFEKSAGRLLKHIIYPVPTDRTKGVVIFPSAHGNLVVGPTAEDVQERENPSISSEVTKELIAHGLKVVPSLRAHKVIGTYAGIRPATQNKDYQIKVHPDRKWITVGGIRSTGASGCLGIAEHVLRLLREQLLKNPETGSRVLPGAATLWETEKPSVVLDGAEYLVTHPLFGMGRVKDMSKL